MAMNPEHVRLIYDYNVWANRRSLDSCAGLSQEEFTRDLGSSFRSMRDTLVHILAAELIWLERWKGGTPTQLEPADRYPGLELVRQRLTEVDNQLIAFASELGGEKMASVLHYRTTDGKEQAQPYWQMMQHLANHGTYHRGQVTTLLRQLGAKPVATDLITYFREGDAKRLETPPDGERIHLLYDYNAWANHRALGASATLTEEQFTRDLGSSFRSVRDTLAHIMEVEWLYLERWNGRSPSTLPPAERYPNLASVTSRWEEIERDLNRFVATRNAADLAQRIDYCNTKRAAYSNPLWEMLRHLVNHSTYHRGQVATLLRQLGAKPASTDLILFYRQRAAQATA
jgi:uncharacterized damage-inducible protein DinB